MKSTGRSEAQFGDTVRRLRVEKGISLRKFAEKVEMSPTYLSKVERNEFKPPGEKKVRAIAKELGQDPDALLGLAGRFAEDLVPIIKRHPKEMATFLRAARGLSAEEIKRLAEEVRRRAR